MPPDNNIVTLWNAIAASYAHYLSGDVLFINDYVVFIDGEVIVIDGVVVLIDFDIYSQWHFECICVEYVTIRNPAYYTR